MLETSYSLASLGQIVRVKFDNLLEAIRTLPKDIVPGVESDDEETDWKETVYQEKERFELWSNNLGLYHKGHSSLDYRFRDAPDVFDHASDVLLEIGEAQENILHCLKVKNEERAVTSETPRKGQNIQQTILAKAEPLYSDSENEEEDLDGYDEPDLELSLTLEQIVLCNTKLYRLSSRVQSLRSRHGMGHAHKLMDVDGETGRDLMNAYADYDEQHIRESISLLYKNSNQSSDVSSIDWLIKRLAQANTLRRKQFKQWRRHHDKVSRASNIAVARFEQLRQGIEVSAQDSNSLSRDENFHRLGSVHGSEKSLDVSLPSAATRLLPGAIDIKDDRSIRTSSTYFHLAESANLDLIQVPKLPSMLQEKDSFECPYCFILCSKRMTRLSAWTTHVWHDLRPYVCTFRECKFADHIFSTARQWISHEATHFPSQDDVAQRKTSCPLCAQGDVSMYHIASHMQRLALFALPRTIDYGDGENDEQGGYASDDVSDQARQNPARSSLRTSLLSSSDAETESTITLSDSWYPNFGNGPASVHSPSGSEQNAKGDLESIGAEGVRESEFFNPEIRISRTSAAGSESGIALDETELDEFTGTDHGSRSFENDTYSEAERALLPDVELNSIAERKWRRNSDYPSGLNLCLICFGRFIQYRALKDHFEQSHVNGRPDPCSVCSASGMTAEQRADHETSHTNEEKGYVCRGITPADGIAWGCEQRFCFLGSRTEHFRSAQGQVCMQALDTEFESRAIRVEPGFDDKWLSYPKALQPFLPCMLGDVTILNFLSNDITIDPVKVFERPCVEPNDLGYLACDEAQKTTSAPAQANRSVNQREMQQLPPAGLSSPALSGDVNARSFLKREAEDEKDKNPYLPRKH